MPQPNYCLACKDILHIDRLVTSNLNEVFQPDDMFPQQKLNYGGHFHQAGPDPEKDKEKLEQALEDLPVEPT